MENTKLDYNKMKTKDIIHLISNQVIGEKVSEQNKLVIQDCCKSLYEKKCSEYVLVHYQKIQRIKKRYPCPCDNDDCMTVKHPIVKCKCSERKGQNRMMMMMSRRICKIEDEGYNVFMPGKMYIAKNVIKMFDLNGF